MNEKRYRLKRDAVKFFHSKHANAIYRMSQWDEIGVHENALEEVQLPRIESGYNTGGISTTLNCFDEGGSKFYFTLRLPNDTLYQHEKYSDGQIVRLMLNQMENAMISFYDDFIRQIDENAKTEARK